MGLCVNLGYEVVTDAVNVPDSGSVHEFRVSAPTGKKPVSGGFNINWTDYPVYRHQTANYLKASYPDGDDWVFEFVNAGVLNGYDVDLYAVCINT